MSVLLRKYFSLFFLTLFLFPFIQKAVHDLEHASEQHCTDHSTPHFHELSHTCSLCDYATGKEASQVTAAEIDWLVIDALVSFSEPLEVFSRPDKYSISLRGPPVLF